MNILPSTYDDIKSRLSQFLKSDGFLDPDIKVSTMARKLGTNRIYLAELLRDEYGLTIMSFLNKYRINYAKKLISSSDHPLRVKEVSQRAGYKSATSFYRNFIKEVGVPPSEWISRNFKRR